MPDSPQDLHKKILGRKGEKLVEKYLKKQGCKILERNYRAGHNELDIIAEDKEHTVFVEVKTRSNNDYGGGAYAVTYQKQQRIIRAAQNYLLKYDDIPVRFDVIVVNASMEGKKFKIQNIEHIKNAF